MSVEVVCVNIKVESQSRVPQQEIFWKFYCGGKFWGVKNPSHYWYALWSRLLALFASNIDSIPSSKPIELLFFAEYAAIRRSIIIFDAENVFEEQMEMGDRVVVFVPRCNANLRTAMAGGRAGFNKHSTKTRREQSYEA